MTSYENALLAIMFASTQGSKVGLFELLTYVSITVPLVDAHSFKSVVKPRYVLQPRKPVWYCPETNSRGKHSAVVPVDIENNYRMSLNIFVKYLPRETKRIDQAKSRRGRYTLREMFRGHAA